MTLPWARAIARRLWRPGGSRLKVRAQHGEPRHGLLAPQRFRLRRRSASRLSRSMVVTSGFLHRNAGVRMGMPGFSR